AVDALDIRELDLEVRGHRAVFLDVRVELGDAEVLAELQSLARANRAAELALAGDPGLNVEAGLAVLGERREAGQRELGVTADRAGVLAVVVADAAADPAGEHRFVAAARVSQLRRVVAEAHPLELVVLDRRLGAAPAERAELGVERDLAAEVAALGVEPQV